MIGLKSGGHIESERDLSMDCFSDLQSPFIPTYCWFVKTTKLATPIAIQPLTIHVLLGMAMIDPFFSWTRVNLHTVHTI